MIMKIRVVCAILIFEFSSAIFANTPTLQQQYPHWNLNNKQQYRTVVRLDKFINSYKNQGDLAIFDWDGTLYSQQIPFTIARKNYKSWGSTAWLAWSINRIGTPNYSFLFPMFHTTTGSWKNNVVQYFQYISNYTNVKASLYQLISGLASMQAGMTPQEFNKSIDGYLQQYPTKKYAFPMMLDVLQRLVNSGFNVWIVSGTNGYYLAKLIHNIEHTIYYQPHKFYHFGLAHVPFRAYSDHIIGNEAKLMPDGRFSMVFDESFTKNRAHKLYIVNAYGKELAIKNYIQAKYHKPALFYAGNSSGDIAGIDYVLKQPGALAIAVNPDKPLTNLANQYSARILVVHATPQAAATAY